MLVKHINNNTFDIFYDSGWENWARFKHDGKQIVQIAGTSVPKQIHIFLSRKYGKQ